MKPFPRSYDFKQIEADVSELWEKEEVISKSISYDKKKKLFSFLEGPPTANAPPALHHVEVRVFKDLVCRYKYMQGYSVPRKGGWDCHGLPVEVQVEKKLGLSTKKDVVKYGIKQFNYTCKTDVFNFIGEWNKLTEKMAYWVDLENAYVTMNRDYMESVWWSLKELFNKGLLYEGHKVVPFCPRCSTPLSSHEVALGYADVTEDTVVVKFKLKGAKERYLLAWTTTPWTLPSNLALAVSPEITYAVVEKSGKQYVLAKDLADKYFDKPMIINEFKGKELEGKEYEPIFDYFVGKTQPGKKAWQVILADFVTTEEGTGIVHQAPAFGEEDYDICKLKNVAFVQPVNEDGEFTSEVADFAGMRVKEADKKIIEHLEKEGGLFKVEKYTHTYPFCWRCDTPLIYYAMKSWFIRVSSYRQRLLELNEQISWYPEHIKEGRFGNWLEGAKDWALSRKKFWGTPLPIWVCECGEKTAIGSIEELKKLAANAPKEIELHKPEVDSIKLKCKKCGKQMSRVEDVIDCWYDSGSATFAQFHYPFENKELFQKSFPYDFIAEATDQTRGWFYTLHVLGALLFDSVAYKSVVCAGLLVDEKGEKMSKSKGNVFNPWDAFEKVGVDAVRLQMCASSPGNVKRFGYELVKESITPFLTILWNCANFTNELLKNAKPENKELQIEDEWLLSRANTLIETVTEQLEKHEYNNCVSEIKNFVNEDLSRWYIKIVRDRAAENDPAVAYTLHFAMSAVSKLLAPFTPYLSEAIYQYIAKEKEASVHLSAWPKAEKTNPKLESDMEIAREVVQALLFAREKAQLGVRWPAEEAVIVTEKGEARESAKALSAMIKKQANIKKLALTSSFASEEKIRLDFEKIKSLGDTAPQVIAKFATSSPSMVAHIKEEGKCELEINGKKVALSKEHLIIEHTPPKGYVVSEFSHGQVYLKTELSPELESEGYARELMRRIQEMRKQENLNKNDRIRLFVKAEPKALKAIAAWHEQIADKVGAKEKDFQPAFPQHELEVKNKVTIKNFEFELMIEKLQNPNA